MAVNSVENRFSLFRLDIRWGGRLKGNPTVITLAPVTNTQPYQVHGWERLSNGGGARKPNAYSDVVLRGLGYKGYAVFPGWRETEFFPGGRS